MPNDWTDQAACAHAHPDTFYPDPSDDDGITAALNICFWCPVQALCLTDAVTRGERHGVWGGTTEAQRDTLIRQHRKTQRRERRRTNPTP